MACATAKRKCGRQIPQCLRCRQRGLACKYPPAKPSSFVLCASDDEGSQGQGRQVHRAIPIDGAPNHMITTQAPQAPQAHEVPIWSAGSNQDADGTTALLPLTPAWAEDQQQNIVPYGSNCSMLANRLFGPTAAAAAETAGLPMLGFEFGMGSLNEAAPMPAATTPKMTVPPPFPDMSFADIIPGFGTSAFTTMATETNNNNNSLVSKSWFTGPETWKVSDSHVGNGPLPQIVLQGMKHSILKTKRWLEQWVKEGHSPFIHQRLYQDRFPPCIQDAYLVLSAYVHKTPANEAMVLRLIGERAAKFLAEYGYEYGYGYGEEEESRQSRGDEGFFRASRPRDALEHLARCHALLIYQIIGLYDGDIHLRHVCEGRIPILNRWMDEMAEYASRVSSPGDALTPPSLERLGERLGGGGSGLPGVPSGSLGGARASSATDTASLLWDSWILSESVRRTWVVSAGVQGVYTLLQQGRLPRGCKGNMMFTTHRRVWEAPSASAWEQLCVQVNIKLSEVSGVFADLTPHDIDDFTSVVIETVFGAETLQKWSVS